MTKHPQHSDARVAEHLDTWKHGVAAQRMRELSARIAGLEAALAAKDKALAAKDKALRFYGYAECWDEVDITDSSWQWSMRPTKQLCEDQGARARAALGKAGG